MLMLMFVMMNHKKIEQTEMKNLSKSNTNFKNGRIIKVKHEKQMKMSMVMSLFFCKCNCSC